ncbi:hypothetical protein [Aeromonas veronii]|uniref:hypothetical protein n=1 Tax=Aeromonas veronii TaxID=654 RepID=UPI0024176FEE|nr:hypothetical protein [Aeromonas veronii]WFO52531.1 hypothetical protein L1O00_05835 [Aeromonas veronii]
MAKRKKTSFTNEHSTINDVEGYYVDSEASLKLFYNVNLQNSPIPARFFGYSKNEIFDELKERKETLDRMCSLELLAAIEARIRVDYLVRCQNKLKDALSRDLRLVYSKKENKASLKDDIISAWKIKHPNHKEILDNFGKSLDYRNWLAHGRYWLPKKAPHIYRYDYLTIYTLAHDIFSNMELLEGT